LFNCSVFPEITPGGVPGGLAKNLWGMGTDGAGFLQGGCLCCHAANNVEALKENKCPK